MEQPGLPLTPLFEIAVQLGAPVSVGRASDGERRMVPILGGTVRGRIEGEVLAGGADWQVLRPDGFADIDARYQLRSSEGAVVEVRSRGMRRAPPEVRQRLMAGEAVDPDLYYFRTALRFESGAPALQWLVGTLAVARGERLPDAVLLRAFAVG